MFCTLWARGCQTFRVERQQICHCICCDQPRPVERPTSKGWEVLCKQMQPGFFCWRKPNAGFQGPCSHSESRTSPAAVPPLSAHPHSPLLPALIWDGARPLWLIATRPNKFQLWNTWESVSFSQKKVPQGWLMIPSLQASHPKCSQGLLKVHQHIWIGQ